MIRPFTRSNFQEIQAIHDKFYKDDFPFPDFLTNWICAFTSESDGRIVCAGGIRAIVELVVLTDKDASSRQRRNALYEMLATSSKLAKDNDYDQIHAFIDDKDNWKRILNKVGFKQCKGNALVIDI